MELKQSMAQKSKHLLYADDQVLGLYRTQIGRDHYTLHATLQNVLD